MTTKQMQGRNHQQYGEGRNIDETCGLFLHADGERLTWRGWLALSACGAVLGGSWLWAFMVGTGGF